MATLLLKSSHKEQPSVIHLLWAKGLGANAVQFEMRPIMVTSILQDWQYMFGVKSLLMVEKVLLMRKNLVATIAAVDFLMQSRKCRR